MPHANKLFALSEAAHSFESRYLDLLGSLVSRESPTADKTAADALADDLETALEDEGWQVERIEVEPVGDQLVARRNGTGTVSTLLLCHYDTVWQPGTIETMPYRRDGDKIYGPGILDMKAGIVSAMMAPSVARRVDHEIAGPLTLLITSDEETGSLHSRPLIEQLAVEHDRVLVLEPARDDGALKIGRKGTACYWATLHGRSAHAGVNPEQGASALRELAHFLFHAEGLTDTSLGTTVNVTVAAGGTVSNVIPEQARGEVDVRVPSTAEGERVNRAICGYTPRDPRVKVSVEGGLNRPPLEVTQANRRLFGEAQSIAAQLGFELDGAVVGGGSDGNFTSALAVPTLDGLGAVGGGPHARHEHIRMSETLDRLALLAGLLCRQ